ncbi:MAG: MOSC domain-containing protein [Gammaproteobacteria bacterium]|nr:MOSC domain-containing protein [Gammaproteobacteria bacterium]
MNANLKHHFSQSGKIEWIGLRRASGEAMVEVNSAELLQDHGLQGDKAGKRAGSSRQVTLIQAEYLPVISSFLGREQTFPHELRRNIVVSGINIGICKGLTIGIRDSVIQVTGDCVPCAKMEKALGYGGFNAMLNHGGVTAAVLAGGTIAVGDEIRILDDQASET